MAEREILYARVTGRGRSEMHGSIGRCGTCLLLGAHLQFSLSTVPHHGTHSQRGKTSASFFPHGRAPEGAEEERCDSVEQGFRSHCWRWPPRAAQAAT